MESEAEEWQCSGGAADVYQLLRFAHSAHLAWMCLRAQPLRSDFRINVIQIVS